ncbi:phosphodiester glycosidase family protein [Rhizohabitans arisaemae]|uniref:phosphodiester glycosidase family protein n=1 Tax=Rhizohabitans arisaemae TaxID=2720610 RepID=UPI0024B1B600|nr:phosphodiester glycosidase family protein [Rhizohabitans arisaemae]
MVRRSLFAGIAASTFTAPLVIAPQSVAATSAPPPPVVVEVTRFPLGPQGKTAATLTRVGPGVDLYKYTHGVASDGWTVSVIVNRGREYGTLAMAESKAQEVIAAGFEPRVEPINQRAVADAPARIAGYTVRVGMFGPTEKKLATDLQKELADAQIPAKVDFLGDDGADTAGGPWDLRVVTVDPRRFGGAFEASLGKSVAARETTTSMAKARKAIAAINGGFFNIHAPAEMRGEPVGISVVAGKLLSEGVSGRTALVLRGKKAQVTELSATVRLNTPNGGHHRVDGVNRPAVEADRIMQYTAEWGVATPAGDGTEAVLDAAGTVTELRPRGGKVPAGGSVIQGVGEGVAWLEQNVAVGATLKVTTSVVDLRAKRRITLDPTTHIVGGGIAVVRNGKTWINAKTNGHASLNMLVRRHPRTLAGVGRGGRLILVTVDGRKPESSVGATMHEAARLMLWLGAREAINLDGGGSTTMVVGNKVRNRPSDGRERTVGDALLVTP